MSSANVPGVSGLSPLELAELLEKLDAVCKQARELADTIKRRMAQSARDNYPANEATAAPRRKEPRKPSRKPVSASRT